MSDEDQRILEVCTHHQTGFCKYRTQCHKNHNNELCQTKICRDTKCTKRHPKTCKYFERNNTCKYNEHCAFSHPERKHLNSFENIKEEVKQIKYEIQELKTNTARVTKELFEMQYEEIIQLKQQIVNLSNNMSEMMCRIMNIETKSSSESNSKMKNKFSCDQCQYECSKELTLKKHMNTKHGDTEMQDKIETTVCDLECSHCEDTFISTKELRDHIEEHLEEVQNIDIEYLKNGHESFVCNKCIFNSNDVDKIKVHLSNHIINDNPPVRALTTLELNETNIKLNDEITKESKETEEDKKVKKYNWRDDFDEFGNYIGPESSESETDTETDDEE